MWLPDDCNETGSIFLLAAWYELYYGFTPDSFQPRLHNVASLVEELVDIGQLWQREPRFASHIKMLQAELAGNSCEERHQTSNWFNRR